MLEKASEILKSAKHITAFTGAGISVESGIPPFRGENGLWNKFDPIFLDINYFHNNPLKSWKLIKEIFYDFFGQAKPNDAHLALVKLPNLKAIITQNIDNLHQLAGSTNIFEFHGNSRTLLCENCGVYTPAAEVNLEKLPPLCEKCKTVLKPDFVFFGEPIPEPAGSNSFNEAQKADVFLLIGTTGEIMPASVIPYHAKENGATIIEINIEPSNYTKSITDIFLRGKATTLMNALLQTMIQKKN